MNADREPGRWRAETDRRLDALEQVQSAHGTAIANLITRMGELEAWRASFEPDPPPDPPPGPRFGFIDATRTHAELDQLLADAAGVGRPVGTFKRGFSGTAHPATFDASSVADARALGIGAVLNTKLPWQGLSTGTYDDKIRTFWESWPVEVWGDFTVNHEPENDAPTSGSQYPSNPDWLAWADVNGPVWCAGVARYIGIAAPIIRARGLDVRIGGVLMNDRSRWGWFDWWQWIDPADLDVVTFGLDAYSKHHANPVRGADIMPAIRAVLDDVVRPVGITSLSLFETAVDRRRFDSEGGGVIGTDQTCATWLEAYAAALTEIPETRTVCHFHDPVGPASAYAQLKTVDAAAWAAACMAGARP